MNISKANVRNDSIMARRIIGFLTAPLGLLAVMAGVLAA